jgi:hypothetical protein
MQKDMVINPSTDISVPLPPVDGIELTQEQPFPSRETRSAF